MSTPIQGLITPHQQLTALLAAAQRIAQQMADSGVWDEVIWNACESIDAAVMEVEGTHALTSDERAVRARDDADDWRFEQRREESGRGKCARVNRAGDNLHSIGFRCVWDHVLEGHGTASQIADGLHVDGGDTVRFPLRDG